MEIAGIIFSEPFRDFGYNRTVALRAAAAWGEYAILLDADMVLEIAPSFSKAVLLCGTTTISIRQRAGDLEQYKHPVGIYGSALDL